MIVSNIAVLASFIYLLSHGSLTFRVFFDIASSAAERRLSLARRLWSLKIKRNHAIQRRGGFSPPGSVIDAMGRGKPAPTWLRLIFLVLTDFVVAL